MLSIQAWSLFALSLLGARSEPVTWRGHIEVDGERFGLAVREDSRGRRVSLPDFGWYDVPAGGAETAWSLTVYGTKARVELAGEEDWREGRWSGWGFEGNVRLERSSAPTYGFEDLDFSNGDLRLRGTLILPPGDGPFPAVVWSHGSGNVTREDPVYRGLAMWFVERGIASLVYDKRPRSVGGSFDALALDAIAGVEALRGHERIRADRIGVGGLSQGGWVAPLAAKLSDRVGFVVGLSAPAISPGEQNIYNQANKVRNAGFGQAEADEATRILRAIYAYLRTGEGKREVLAELASAKKEPWYEAAYELPIWSRQGLPPAPWEHVPELDHDAVGVWRDVRVPVVCAWGEDDSVVPARQGEQAIGQALDESGNGTRRLIVVPGTGHDLRAHPRPSMRWGLVPARLEAVPGFVLELDAQETGQTAYPPARRSQHVDVHHGVEVADPYRGLESNTPETREWLAAQDELLRDFFGRSSELAATRRRMEELRRHSLAAVPIGAGGRDFFRSVLPDDNWTHLFVRDEDGEARMLVNPHELTMQGQGGVGVSGPLPGPHGELVLYGAAGALSEIRLCTADGEALVDDTVQAGWNPAKIAWAPDGSGFYYVRGTTLHFHALGTDPLDDPALYTESGPGWQVYVEPSADGEFLFVAVAAGSGPRNRAYVARLDGPPVDGDLDWITIDDTDTALVRMMGSHDGALYLFTTRDAPGGRIVRVRPDEPDAWQEVVPELDVPVWELAFRRSYAMVGERLALLYRRDRRPFLRVHGLDGALVHEIRPERIGFNNEGLVHGPDQGSRVRFDVGSLADAATVFEADLETGELSVLVRTEHEFEPVPIELALVEVPADDGALIPMLLAWRAGHEPDPQTPVLMYTDAAFGTISRPFYRPLTQAWLEKGGVYAHPGLRGGGDRGQAWQDAGRRRNKPVAVSDYLAAARWLAESEHTSRGRIVISGASSTGPIATAAFLKEPELFAAALIRIPALDLTKHPLRDEEFGTVADPDDFEVLLSWSPYHHVEERAYPPVLVQVGELDSVTPPWHGYKFVAALQHAQQAPIAASPVLLQVAPNAGHGQGPTVEQMLDVLARQLDFAWRMATR